MTRKVPGRISLVAVLAAAATLAALPARALEIGVGAGAGTLGAGAALTVGVTETLNARVGFGRFTYDEEFEDAGVLYDGELTIGGTYALADWHPWGGGFRLSGGLIANANELSGSARLSGPTEIGGRTYQPSEIGSLEASVDFDSTAPYLGIGYGNGARGASPLTFNLDVGLMFQGKPNVNLVARDGTLVASSQFQDDLDAEEEQLEQELDSLVDVEVYPVIALGLAVRF